MSILLERTKREQAPTVAPQGEPVQADQEGTVAWKEPHGARVAGWATLGEVFSASEERLIACPASGILHHVAKEGERVRLGQIVAYVMPPEAQQRPATTGAPIHASPAGKAPQGQPGAAPATTEPRQAATGWQAPAPRRVAPSPVDRPTTVQQPSNSQAGARRSTMSPEVELLEVEELRLEELPSKPKARQPVERVKIVKLTVHPNSQQVRDFEALAAAMGEECSASELHRIAFSLLLSLPRRALLEELEKQRDQEQAGRYGYGNRPIG